MFETDYNAILNILHYILQIFSGVRSRELSFAFTQLLLVYQKLTLEINFVNDKNVAEFGTLNPKIWSNYLSFLN